MANNLAGRSQAELAEKEKESARMKKGRVSKRCGEKQDEHTILKKGTTMLQGVDMKYGLI